MNILAVGAHPDDVELGCAGTLARYAQQGQRVTIAIFTSGNMGDFSILPDELAVIRRKEAEASAALISAGLLCAGVTDESVFPNEAQRAIMIDLLRETDPDIIITHSPTDYHPDHRYVSQLVFDSYFQKGLPHIRDQKEPACRFGQTQIYYMDNLAGIGFQPTEYVDITETFEVKKQMLACHASQLKAVKEPAEINLLEMLEALARLRGFAARCKYAEGFCRLETFHRGLSRRLLP